MILISVVLDKHIEMLSNFAIFIIKYLYHDELEKSN